MTAAARKPGSRKQRQATPRERARAAIVALEGGDLSVTSVVEGVDRLAFIRAAIAALSAEFKGRSLNLRISPTETIIIISPAGEPGGEAVRVVIGRGCEPELYNKSPAQLTEIAEELGLSGIFVEDEQGGYNSSTMDTAAAFAAAARTFSDRELKEYIQRGELAAAVLRERETTGRATAAPRPKWEKDALPDEDPAHFAARAGYEHRGLIHDEDRALSVKLSNWLRTHDWPEGVRYVPTKPEWNTAQLVKLPQLRDDETTREVQRLAMAASRRRAKQARKISL
jgi:hypothetical protein